MFKVYRIKNNINGKSYIGITSRDIEARIKEHISRAMLGVRHSRLYDAIRKYGFESFNVTEVASTNTEDSVRKMETEYINKYDSYNNGYNCNLGGCGHLHISEELRKKISDSQKGKIISIEARRKQSELRKGDKSFAKRLGDHTKKGENNPKSKYFLIETPSGDKIIIKGLRQFCRDNNLTHCKLSSNSKTKGFRILKRFNDYPEMEYTQASGKGTYPDRTQDKDIVCSA